MDDKRTALAIFLSMLVILVYYEVVVGPQQPETGMPASSVAQPTGQPTAEQPAPQAAVPVAPQPPAPAAAQAYRMPPRQEYNTAASTAVDADDFSAVISHLGGRLLSFKLNRYKATLKNPAPLDLVPEELPILPLGIYTGGISDADVAYTLSGFSEGARRDQHGRFQLGEGEAVSLRFSGSLANGAPITKTIKFSQGSYLFTVEAALGAEPSDNNSLLLEWTTMIPKESPEESWNPRSFTMLENDGSVLRIPPVEVTPAFRPFSVRWSSFSDNYFLTALIPPGEGQNAMLAGRDNVYYSSPHCWAVTGYWAL